MMNSKKKADLQRKLTLAQVPTPPADLLERIKRDIPPHLVIGAPSEQARFTRSIFFDMRVAASVLLIVTSAFLALQFLSHTDHEKLARLESPVPRAPLAQVTLTAENGRMSEPVRTARFDTPVDAAPATPVVPAITPRQKDRRNEAPVYTFDAVEETTALAQPAPSPAVAQAAPAPVAPPPPPVAEAITVTASAPTLQDTTRSNAASSNYAYAPFANSAGGSGFLAEAKAADLQLKRKSESVFGISTDDRAFERIKTAIEHGEQPQSDTIDVAALVNYFAGSAKHESHDVKLEAEGSPAPVMSEPGRRLIRVTIDTQTADIPPGGSLPPIATGAKIDVQFDNSAVVAYHLVGADTMQIEPTLLKNTSVTALYDVMLSPRGAGWQRVASFRVTYTSVADGQERTQEKMLRRRDLEKTWISASRRHRLASLGAVWGETLKGMAGANDVARRAEELASQAPEDEKARELRDVANATKELHGTASGSSR